MINEEEGQSGPPGEEDYQKIHKMKTEELGVKIEKEKV
jgi:hypothetical protein